MPRKQNYFHVEHYKFMTASQDYLSERTRQSKKEMSCSLIFVLLCSGKDCKFRSVK